MMTAEHDMNEMVQFAKDQLFSPIGDLKRSVQHSEWFDAIKAAIDEAEQCLNFTVSDEDIDKLIQSRKAHYPDIKTRLDQRNQKLSEEQQAYINEIYQAHKMTEIEAKKKIIDNLDQERKKSKLFVDELRSLDKTDPDTFDLFTSLAAEYILLDQIMPNWLAEFAADVLRGKHKPKKRPKRTDVRNYKLGTVVDAVHQRYGLTRYDLVNPENTCVAVVSKATSLSYESIRQIYMKYDNVIRAGSKQPDEPQEFIRTAAFSWTIAEDAKNSLAWLFDEI